MHNRQNFISYQPHNKQIRAFIAYYYFHFSESDHNRLNFVFYPNTKNAVTVYQNSKLDFDKGWSSAKPKNNCLSINYSGVQTGARVGEIVAPFNKIGIVFQPLGINHFIDQPLTKLISHGVNKSFSGFNSQFNAMCESVFKTNNCQQKVDLLAAYFASNLTDFDEPVIKNAITEMNKLDCNLTIDELADKVHVSRRTLLRHFKKHLCCSPKEYSNVLKFRKSIGDYLEGESEIEKLTDLALKFGYYDQSDFIKNIHKLTGESPMSFFKNVSVLGNERTFWKIG